MAKRSRRTQKTQTNSQGLVVITFAEDLEQAKNYETLLKADDIPVVIESKDDSEGVAIMVPEEFLDEAHVIIESQDAYDDFYDLTAEGEGDGYFDDDFLEDEL